MTRNRTQTTLTRLATRVAAVHGELAFVEGRQADEVAALPEDWLKPFGRGMAARKRYEAARTPGTEQPSGCPQGAC